MYDSRYVAQARETYIRTIPQQKKKNVSALKQVTVEK